MKQNKTSIKKHSHGSMPDYGYYRFTKTQLAGQAAGYGFLSVVISELFFRNLWLVLLFAPGFYLYLKESRAVYRKKRDARIRSQFLTGMQLVSTSLASGYAVENAFREALMELRKIYEEDSFVVTEFRHITTQIRLNNNIESLLLNLGERSHQEDIRNFAEVFLAAKRTGGDLMLVIRNTVSSMRQKEETLEEIDTVLAGKKMEQNIMSLIPILIIGYISLTSPESLDGMYHTETGIIIMSICLAVYLAAFLWGRKIMDLTV